MEPKITNCKDRTINLSNIYLILFYILYFSVRKVFHKIMQHKFFKEVSIFDRCLINNILHFKSNLFDVKLKILNLD